MRALISDFARARERHVREATLNEYLRLLRPFNRLQAEGLLRRDVVGVIEKSPSPRHTLAAVSVVCKWAVSTGRMDHDPTLGLKKVRLASRDRVLDLEEIAAVWAATCDGSDFSRIVRLLLLTGCRREEIGGLPWVEVREDRIVLSAERVKNGRPHQVPLTPLALEQLPRRRKAFVFGRRRSTGFSGWSKAKADLDQASGISAWRLHDLRRSFVTHCAENRLAAVDVIEAFVNHVSGVRAGVAGVYNRSHLWPERVALAGRWSDLLIAWQSP